MKRLLPLLLALVLLLCACGSAGKGAKTPEKAVENYIHAIFSYDAKGALECWPDFYIESMMEDYGVSKESDLLEAMKEEVEGREKRNCKVLKTEADHDCYDEDDLEEFRETVGRQYDLTEKQLRKITALCQVTVTVEIDGDQTRDDVLSFQYDGSWYVLD